MRMCVSACLPVCVCICVCCGLQQLQDSLDGVCREWMRYEAELKVRTHNEVIMNKWTAPKWARVQCSICNSLSWPAQPQTLSLSHFVPAHLLTFYFLLNLLMSLPWLQPLNPPFFFFFWSLSRALARSHPRCCSLLIITDIFSIWLLSFSACPTLSASAIMLTLGCCTFIISLSLTYFHISLSSFLFSLSSPSLSECAGKLQAVSNWLLCPLWKRSTGCRSSMCREHPVHSMQCNRLTSKWCILHGDHI